MSTTARLEVFTKLGDEWRDLTQSELREQLTLKQLGGDKTTLENSLLLGMNAHLVPRNGARDWYVNQSYLMFSHLAGVRNGQRGDPVLAPIFELNGYPDWHPAYVDRDNYPNDPYEHTGAGEVGFCTPRAFLAHRWPEPVDELFRWDMKFGLFVWANALSEVYGPDNATFVFSFSH